MAKDPVCGMEVDEKKAKFKSEHMGKTYYFCSEMCKKLFDKDPKKFMKPMPMHHERGYDMCEHGYQHESEQASETAEHGKRHLLIMALCCLIPIVMIIALVFANVESTYLYFLLILLCPLMHLLSMLPRRKRIGERAEKSRH